MYPPANLTASPTCAINFVRMSFVCNSFFKKNNKYSYNSHKQYKNIFETF